MAKVGGLTSPGLGDFTKYQGQSGNPQSGDLTENKMDFIQYFESHAHPISVKDGFYWMGSAIGYEQDVKTKFPDVYEKTHMKNMIAVTTMTDLDTQKNIHVIGIVETLAIVIVLAFVMYMVAKKYKK